MRFLNMALFFINIKLVLQIKNERFASFQKYHRGIRYIRD